MNTGTHAVDNSSTCYFTLFPSRVAQLRVNQLEQAALDALDGEDDGEGSGVDNTAAVVDGPWVAGGTFTGARRVLYVR